MLKDRLLSVIAIAYSSRIRCKSSDVSETAQDSDVVKLIGGSLTTMVYQIAALYFL